MGKLCRARQAERERERGSNAVLASTFVDYFQLFDSWLSAPLSHWLAHCATMFDSFDCLSHCPSVCLSVPLCLLRLSVSVSFSCCIQLLWTAAVCAVCLSIALPLALSLSISLLPTTSLFLPRYPSLLLYLTIKRSDCAFDSLLCVLNIFSTLQSTLSPSLSLSFIFLSLSRCNLHFSKTHKAHLVLHIWIVLTQRWQLWQLTEYAQKYCTLSLSRSSTLTSYLCCSLT